MYLRRPVLLSPSHLTAVPFPSSLHELPTAWTGSIMSPLLEELSTCRSSVSSRALRVTVTILLFPAVVFFSLRKKRLLIVRSDRQDHFLRRLVHSCFFTRARLGIWAARESEAIIAAVFEWPEITIERVDVNFTVGKSLYRKELIVLLAFAFARRVILKTPGLACTMFFVVLI